MKPLALYVFTESNQFANEIIKSILWRGCINDTVVHLSNSRLPFGLKATVDQAPITVNIVLIHFRTKKYFKKKQQLDLPLRYA
jgi:aldehyde dehydrogenase (NAD+)